MKSPGTTDDCGGADVTVHTSMSRWVSTIVIVSAGLLLTGAVLSKTAPTLMTHGDPVTNASRIYADYFFARNVPLAMGLLLLLGLRRPQMLAGLLILTSFVQALDVINVLTRSEYVLVPGLLLLCAAMLVAAQKLLSQSMWRSDAWPVAPSERQRAEKNLQP